MPLNTLLPAFNQDVLQGHADDLGAFDICRAAVPLSVRYSWPPWEICATRVLPIVSRLGWGAITAAFGAFEVQWAALVLIAAIGMLSS